MKQRLFAALALILLCSYPTRAAELARFSIREPLAMDWTDEWITEEVDLQVPPGGVRSETLRVLTESGEAVPAQFYSQRRLVPDLTNLLRPMRVSVFLKVSLPKNQTAVFRITDDKATPRPTPIQVVESAGKIVINNGIYELEFDRDHPLPINAMRSGGTRDSVGDFRWPSQVRATNVADRFSERGPARVIFRREFAFANSSHHANYRFEVRAGDPWLGIQDSYNLGDGASLELDLRRLNPKVVWHPHAYSARTLKAGSPDEDSTLQPLQYPIATLAPLWRDHWFGGGPFAFLYTPGADHGLGIAAVQAGGWNCRIDIAMESQGLEIRGDRDREGQVRVRLPMDGAHRSWALIFGPPDMRHQLSGLTRSHSDIPLDRVLDRWKLDWNSSAPEFKAPAAQEYLKAHLNRNALGAMPHEVLHQIDQAFKLKHVKSRDLAALAYIFTSPEYWPGPDEAWKTGSPTFHVEKYSVPLRIALLMPDHPDAKQWLEYGVRETYLTLMTESWPGGAWSESPGRSKSFFQIADNVRLLRDYGVTNGFQSWPRLKEVANYLAALHTPEDPRYGARQIAPIGDGRPGNYLAELRTFGFPESVDLASQEFKGFGALLRSTNSFLAFKAGPARHHYHGDELSVHFSALGVPLVIDHASQDTWSATNHNRPDMNGKTPGTVAEPRAFHSSPIADVFVADERATNIYQARPDLALPPAATLSEANAWKMRRYAMLVKHDPQKSKIPDYLVIRDEIVSPEPIGWNLHVLARDIQGDGPTFLFPGQLGVDLTAHFVQPEIKSVEKKDSGNGKIIPEDFPRGTWKPDDGEHTKWLRVQGAPGQTHWLVVLIPNRETKVERLSNTSARITLGNESEIIHLGTDGTHQAALERGGTISVLLPEGGIKPLGEVSFQASKPTRGRKPNL